MQAPACTTRVSKHLDHPSLFFSPYRVQHGAVLYQEALNWLRSAYPYWNRTEGRDHVW